MLKTIEIYLISVILIKVVILTIRYNCTLGGIMNELFLQILAVVVTFAVCFGLYTVRFKLSFALRAIMALGLGIVLGFIFKGRTEYIGMFGTIFTRTISMMVIPLLLFSLIRSISSMKSMVELRSIGFKSIFWLMFQTFLAAILGTALGYFSGLGRGSNLQIVADVEAKEIPTFSEIITDLFSKNVFNSMAEGKIVPIVIFAIFIGIAVVSISSKKDGKQLTTFKNFIEDGYEIVITIVGKIIEFLPYAIVCLMANTVSGSDAAILKPLVLIIVLTYIGCFIHVYCTGSVLLSTFGKTNPVKFFKSVFPAQVMAFSSTSSVGTLPINVKCLTENLNVRPSIANFVAPLSTTMGMSGCSGIWPSLLAVFALNIMGTPIGFEQIAMIVILCPLISVGTAGVPGGGIMLATALYLAMGLPVEYISIFVAIDSFVDMARTMTNVTCSMIASTIVDRSEPKEI